MMRILHLGIFFLLFASKGCQGGELLNMLNGIHEFMGDGPFGSFDPNLYLTLEECFNTFDELLLASQDAQWGGMVQYAATGGDSASGDVWLTCAEDERWFENNCTVQAYGELPIHEPCNYASNLAYYHTVIEICKHEDWNLPPEYVASLVRSFSIMAQGSTFVHGSVTGLGYTMDIRTNDLLTYVIHQASVELLEPLDSSVIHDLSVAPRPQGSITITEDLRDLFVNLPVDQWNSNVDALDIPSVFLAACCLIGTAGSLTFNETELDNVLDTIFDLVPLPEEMREFCQEVYVPAIYEATEHIELGEIQQLRLRSHVIGSIAKYLYASIWQESTEIPGIDITSPEVNEMGWEYLPIVNDLANTLLNYDYYNPNLQHGIDMYPGEDWCNPTIPHAKWHLQTAIALTDMVFLADEIYGIIRDH